MPPSERPAADHQRARAVRRGAAGPGTPAAPGPRAARGRVRPGGGAARRRRADGRPPRARARQEHLPPAADDRPGLPALRDRDRGRPRGGQRRVGRRRRDLAHRRPRRGGGPAQAGHRPPRRRRGRRGARRDPLGRAGHRRGDLRGPAARPRARPHLQGIRAAQVPRPAPGPGLHPRPAAAGGLGLRLLRRHPHGRRPRPAAAGQARPRARGPDRHRAQRRLPVRAGQGRQGGGRRARQGQAGRDHSAAAAR